MGLIVENRLITLNTRYANRINGTYLSSVEFPFKGILKEEDDIVSANISVMNAQIPVSWFTVNASNNQFLYDGIWVTITPGNYQGNNLVTELKSIMNAAIPGSVTSIVLSQATGRLVFTFTASRDLVFPNFIQGGAAGTNFIYLIVGAEPNAIYVGAAFTLPYPLNLLGINRLAIRSSRLLISSYNSFDMGKGINLATIPVDQPSWGLINYTNQTDLNKSALEIKYIDLIDIQIADENNVLIDFQNTNWTCTLVLEIIRNIPDRFLPSFRELTVEAKPAKEENAIERDLNELELLA